MRDLPPSTLRVCVFGGEKEARDRGRGEGELASTVGSMDGLSRESIMDNIYRTRPAASGGDLCRTEHHMGSRIRFAPVRLPRGQPRVGMYAKGVHMFCESQKRSRLEVCHCVR